MMKSKVAFSLTGAKLCLCVLVITMTACAADFETCQTNSSAVCCKPCVQQSSCNYNFTTDKNKCPEHFEPKRDTTRCQRTVQTTTPTNNNDTNLTTEPVLVDIEVCVQNCSSDLYYETDSKAYCCHPGCIGCRGAGLKNCNSCRLRYNNTCVDDCPVGFEKNETLAGNDGIQNHTVYCVEKKNDDKTMDIMDIIIPVAAAAGGVVLLLIIIVIICCCRKKKDQPRRPISILAEKKSQRSPGEDEESGCKPPVAKKPPTRRHNYENTANQPHDLGMKVQQQRDEVGRYVRDPTLNININRPNQGRQGIESIYDNSAMISLNQNMDTRTLSQDELNKRLEQVELEELPTAPSLPSVPDVERRKPAGVISRGADSIAKKVRRISKKFSKNKPAQVERDTSDYIDMSCTSADIKSPGAHSRKPIASPGDITLQQLDGYESFHPKSLKHVKSKPLPMVPSSSSCPDISHQRGRTEKSKPKVAAKPVKPVTDGMSEEAERMENYENLTFEGVKKKSASSKTKHGRMKKKGKEKVDVEVVIERAENMEDYENVKEKAAKSLGEVTQIGENKNTNGKNLEDYENAEKLKMIAESSAQPAKSKDDLDDYENVTNKAEPPTEKVDPHSETLQDYENSEVVTELHAGPGLELYENMKIGQTK